MLSNKEKERYARHLSLPGFGQEAQEKLKQGSVLVIGAGGLGSPALLYLAAAGVGRIGIADGDTVSISNLQRQIAHDTSWEGKSKVESAASRLRALNPEITIEEYPEFLDKEMLREVIARYDFVIEATDSLENKFVTDDVCSTLGKPYNHGAIFQYEGHTMTVLPGSAGLRDLFPDGPDAVSKGEPMGPLGVVPGVLGTLQAAEAIKYLSGVGELLVNRLLCFNLRTMEFYTVSVEKSNS